MSGGRRVVAIVLGGALAVPGGRVDRAVGGHLQSGTWDIGYVFPHDSDEVYVAQVPTTAEIDADLNLTFGYDGTATARGVTFTGSGGCEGVVRPSGAITASCWHDGSYSHIPDDAGIASEQFAQWETPGRPPVRSHTTS